MEEKIRGHKARLAERFNAILRTLSKSLAERAPEDAALRRRHVQLGLVFDALPFAAVELAGPYLYKYRDQILSGEAAERDAFFLACDFDDDLAASENAGRASAVADLIPRVKAAALRLGEGERQEVHALVVELLYLHIDYVDPEGALAELAELAKS